MRAFRIAREVTGARRALGRGRAPAARRRPRVADRADDGRRPAGRGGHALVPRARRPARRSSSGSRAAEAPFARLVAVLPEIGADDVARAAPRGGRDELVAARRARGGRLGARAHARARCRRPTSSPSPSDTGRPVEDVTRAFHLLGRAARHRLAAGRARRARRSRRARSAGRSRPCARTASTRSRELARCALDDAGRRRRRATRRSTPISSARAAQARRLAAVTASLTVEGTGDLPALMLAVRALRALAA